jgi:hypothetical protein
MLATAICLERYMKHDLTTSSLLENKSARPSPLVQ